MSPIRLQGIDAPELHYRPVFPTVTGKPQPSSNQRGDFNAANLELRERLAAGAGVVSSPPFGCRAVISLVRWRRNGGHAEDTEGREVLRNDGKR
ncbi:MAG: hypothetical protein ABIQ73_02935 [Acidimicrobiales bacterium]